MKTFGESERRCEATFLNAGPFWHAYTSGKNTPLLFAEEADFAFVMNVIARAKLEYQDVVILAFEVMNNHFHFVLCAQEAQVSPFWDSIRKRLKRYYPDIVYADLSYKRIDSLNSLRNNIAYTHRNGYVANPDHTPFSYPWGTGRYYFLDAPAGVPYSTVSDRESRAMFRSRTPEMPDDWLVTHFGTTRTESSQPLGYISPASYCALRFGMAMFRDAHHYYSAVSKNVEAYSGLAAEIDDGEFLTDNEMFSQISNILRNQYQGLSLRNLSRAQKFDLARTLRYEFRSSNDQIRRLLALTKYDIDAIFPLTAGK